MKRGFRAREGEQIGMKRDRLVAWEETCHGRAIGAEGVEENAQVQWDFLVWQEWIVGGLRLPVKP